MQLTYLHNLWLEGNFSNKLNNPSYFLHVHIIVSLWLKQIRIKVIILIEYFHIKFTSSECYLCGLSYIYVLFNRNGYSNVSATLCSFLRNCLHIYLNIIMKSKRYISKIFFVSLHTSRNCISRYQLRFFRIKYQWLKLHIWNVCINEYNRLLFYTLQK